LPPTISIDPPGAITCQIGEAPTRSLNYNDPEGEPLTPVITSSNDAVASGSFVPPNTLNITCNAEGTATLTATVDDGTQTASATIDVTVSAAPPPAFDVTEYPEIPEPEDYQAIASNLQAINAAGTTDPTVFSIAGDESLDDPNFLDPMAAGTILNNGGIDGLEATVTHYQGSFGVESRAVGSGWTPNNLLTGPAAPECGAQSPLQCELSERQPSIMLISFTGANLMANYGPAVNNFRTDLEQVVNTVTANGTVPILTTIPNDGSMDPTLLAQYNQAVVEITENSEIPLWNLYVTVDESTPGVGGGGPTDFSPAALNSEANRRNLAALLLLRDIRDIISP
jgi:hypothetical protein